MSKYGIFIIFLLAAFFTVGFLTKSGSDIEEQAEEIFEEIFSEEIFEETPAEKISNEPAGFIPVTDRSFDARKELGWIIRDDPEFTVVLDLTAPASPPFVGQALFPKGLTGGASPIATDIDFDERNFTKLYVSFWLKVSDNWQSHPITNKVLYLWTHQSAVVIIGLVPGGPGGIFPGDPAKMYTSIRLQDTLPEDDVWNGNFNKLNMRANLTEIEFTPGAWHKWEVLLVNNTGREKNGEAHWWLDETKIGEYSDVRFGDESESKMWDRAAWRPVWGGNGAEIREDQYMWMDHYYVSGAK